MTRPVGHHRPGMADINEAADMLGVSERYVRKLWYAGDLVAKDMVGRSPLFYRADIRAWVGKVRGRDRTGRCGLCDRPLAENTIEWGPLRVRLHPTCRPELDRRIRDTLAARYCSICFGTRQLEMPGNEEVSCVCV